MLQIGVQPQAQQVDDDHKATGSGGADAKAGEKSTRPVPLPEVAADALPSQQDVGTILRLQLPG